MYIVIILNAINAFLSFQVNNSINVNSVNVNDNDLMASNGVVHVVKSLLYPAGKWTGIYNYRIYNYRITDLQKCSPRNSMPNASPNKSRCKNTIKVKLRVGPILLSSNKNTCLEFSFFSAYIHIWLSGRSYVIHYQSVYLLRVSTKKSIDECLPCILKEDMHHGKTF